MIPKEKLSQVFEAVEQGAALRDALRQHAGIDLSEKLRDWLLENHHVSYLDAKRKADAAKEIDKQKSV